MRRLDSRDQKSDNRATARAGEPRNSLCSTMIQTLPRRLSNLLILSRSRSVAKPVINLPYVRAFSTPSDTDPPQPLLNTGEQAIYDKLSSRFPGRQLQVQDVSGPPIPFSLSTSVRLMGAIRGLRIILCDLDIFTSFQRVEYHQAAQTGQRVSEGGY